ncbi:integrase core domain-containing protein [Cobetia amphilecti]|uniref:integrase core domain-containing protein n=1 Tax=Cobetia amphilecti TaxID=1055104 RepID=UPI0034C63397|nr:transposase [Gammaproteobacteria bacterium]
MRKEATLAEAQDWVQQFTEWYNHEHRHSALRYVTPSQRHNDEAKGILTQRREVFEAAKQRHPERWSGDIRKLDLPEIVHLNPERDPVPQAVGL